MQTEKFRYVKFHISIQFREAKYLVSCIRRFQFVYTWRILMTSAPRCPHLFYDIRNLFVPANYCCGVSLVPFLYP